MAYSERLRTRLNPLAERACFSQVVVKDVVAGSIVVTAEILAALAEGEPVIKYKSTLNVLKDTYDHSCCLAR
jgi:hypothetical protein